MHEKVGLEHSSKSTKYELEGSYGEPVHEHLFFWKLPNCRESAMKTTSTTTTTKKYKFLYGFLIDF